MLKITYIYECDGCKKTFNGIGSPKEIWVDTLISCQRFIDSLYYDKGTGWTWHGYLLYCDECSDKMNKSLQKEKQ